MRRPSLALCQAMRHTAKGRYAPAGARPLQALPSLSHLAVCPSHLA